MKTLLCCLLLQLAVACGSVVTPADDDDTGDDAGVSAPEIDAGPDDLPPDAGPGGPQPCVLGTSTIGNCTI
jgi:hypothetical protein